MEISKSQGSIEEAIHYYQRIRREVSEGMLYAHARLSENTKTTLETASFLYGLIELLNEKGLLSIAELDERKKGVAKRLVKKNSTKGVGVLLQDPEYEKYSFKSEVEIDCANRIHLCKAACCRLPFALSRQDIREGIILWDLGQPYIIDQQGDGYCTHLDRERLRCAVHKYRPVPCRAYDCRKDEKIWLNFEKQITNPDIQKTDWPRCISKQAAASEFELT